jgi:hypothetical protein
MPHPAGGSGRPDLRAWQRYPARVEAELVWTGSDGGGSTRGLILDIGMGGAKVLADETPPEEVRTRIGCGEANGPREWAEVELVRETRLPSGHRLLRLRFLEPCSLELFAMAVVERD